MFVLILLAAINLLELLIWVPAMWRHRKLWGWLIIILWAVFGLSLLILEFRTWTALLAFFGIYKVINLLRLIEGRTEAQYLFRVSLKTSLYLTLFQLLVIAIYMISHGAGWRVIDWLYVLASLEVMAAMVLTASTLRHLRTTRAPSLTQNYSTDELPSLTVAIPARNESEELTACLQSLVTSDYPKLEIVVLDDCSQEHRTAEIIRSFANVGVRFIPGQVPPDNWLAKNYAYHQLSKVANGEVLLFCGVDTRFQQDSLRLIVETMLLKHKTMLSFIPQNHLPESASSNLFVQPGRYAWELALPRRWLSRPPVLSTCWLITAKTLQASGSFEGVARNASPESYFARMAIKHDGYSFLQSSKAIGLLSVKTFSEQRDTAVRTRYPQLHRRPELVALISLAELSVLVVPFLLLFYGLVQGLWPLVWLVAIAGILQVWVYSRIVSLTYRRFLWRGLWLLPFAAIYDIGILNYSMWQYEFREVIWKGRNICLPIMRVVPALPKLPKTET